MDDRERERHLLLRRARGGHLTPEEDGFLDAMATIRRSPAVGRPPGAAFAHGYTDEDEPPRGSGG